MQFEDFLKQLEEIGPSSVTLGERNSTRNPIYVNWDEQKRKETTSTKIPESMADVAARSKTKEDFLENIQAFNSNEIELIEKETRGQSENPVWTHQRDGRTTASKFREIMTRMQTVKKNANTDVSLLMSRVLGYTAPHANIPALKYGRRMEDVAAKYHSKILREMGHRDIEIKECGLFIHAKYPFLGASPDRLVSCCCGNGILEIKCPLSSSHTTPTVENTECLVVRDGKTVLNSNHKYFDQIQGQMALAQCDWGDFLVYSSHGYFYQRIEYSQTRWALLLENMKMFFYEFLAEELVSRTIQKKIASRQCSMTLQLHEEGQDIATGHVEAVQEALTSQQQQMESECEKSTVQGSSKTQDSPNKKSKKGKKAIKRTQPIYLCGTCELRIKEHIQSDNDQSIMCDSCHTWHHWLCVGLNGESEELGEQECLCPVCS